MMPQLTGAVPILIFTLLLICVQSTSFSLPDHHQSQFRVQASACLTITKASSEYKLQLASPSPKQPKGCTLNKEITSKIRRHSLWSPEPCQCRSLLRRVRP